MYLSQAVRKLGGLPGNSVVGMSGLMETQPLGVVGQGSYLNAAVKIRTDLSLLELYEANRSIERELGRVRTEHWGPRTIDIDLLLYDDRIFRSGVLTIPHPQMHLRSFVLRPMCEIGWFTPSWVSLWPNWPSGLAGEIFFRTRPGRS
jgi:2-amino-4-hydroxy-6-hydroxymethyldihydropteridine diphosphokinase